MGAFSTRRLGGFTDEKVAYLKALSRPLALAIKSRMAVELSEALLNVYLGEQSGEQVLHGPVERGDGRTVNCVLWCCDLRQSTTLADRMPLADYLARLNRYFDYTAGAVIGHGGEVLKFIGDAVLAIFPVDGDTRPAPDMCRAAVMAAREALSRATRGNAERGEDDRPPVEFGISLHTGDVMYGNVGTRRRLDFTVTGPAVNEATRLEGLTKTLGTPLVASRAFRESHAGEMVPIGGHDGAGRKAGVEVFTLPEPNPKPGRTDAVQA